MTFVYNPLFAKTNTSKSLLKALDTIAPDDLVWCNGDVVATEEAVTRLVKAEGNAVGVTYQACGEEEIKFNLDQDGCIREISKQVAEPLGEKVGLNRLCAGSFVAFREALRQCADLDYFEKPSSSAAIPATNSGRSM